MIDEDLFQNDLNVEIRRQGFKRKEKYENKLSMHVKTGNVSR